MTSVLGKQIAATLLPAMQVPPPLGLLFEWIEQNGLFVDRPRGRVGFLFPEAAMKAGRTKAGRPGGTDLEFAAEGNVNLKYWFGSESPDILERLCVFAQTGGDGSMAAFWMDDQGHQRIVHMGSGSGSTLVCVLADTAVDFLRLLAIGYDEICWGEDFGTPPNTGTDFIVQPNQAFAAWVTSTFDVTIPRQASEIVRHPSYMGDADSQDPFWLWVRGHTA